MKHFTSLFFCLLLALCLSQSAMAADGVTTGSLAGGSAVYVSMDGRTGDVALSNGSVVDDAPASNMVSGAVAAVNGGFFSSYYNKGAAMSFPDNCPNIFGVVTKNGEVINGGGMNNAVGFTYDGKVLIDRIKVEIIAVIPYKENAVIWGVNQNFDDDSAIMLLTPALTLPFTARPDAAVYTIRDNKITGVQTGGTHTVAAGTKLLVFNRAALANLQQWQRQPETGDTVQIAYSYTPTRTADAEAWKNIKTAAAGGRMLVQNGVNVTGNTSYNAEFDAIADQSNSSSAQRSYVAQTADGRLVFGTASGTFPAIADGLIAGGITNAVSMDGGASCFLYGNGSVLTAAGRELAVVIQAVASNSAETKPEQVEVTPVGNRDGEPSAWAVPKLEEARSLGLIPDWAEYYYTSPITRSVFCSVLGQMLTKATGKSLDDLRYQTYEDVEVIPYEETAFSDVKNGSDYFIRSCAALRIVNGKGDGLFKPDDPITRQEAAAIMQRAGKILGIQPGGSPKSFSDSAAFAAWAVEPVNYVTACGIMNGVGDRFDPNGSYTREQTFITMLNAYHAVRG